MRRAVFLSLDAALGVAFLVSVMLLMGQFSTSTTSNEQTLYATQDTLLALEHITLGELNDSLVADIVSSTPLDNSSTVLYAAGLLFVLNDSRSSDLLSLFDGQLPPTPGFTLKIEDVGIFERNASNIRVRSVATQQITGIAPGKPLAGASSSAYLQKLQDKVTSSFSYFGGFIGQGEITTTLALPSDVAASRIISVELEVDIESDMIVHINDVQCGGTLTPLFVGDNFTPDYWDLSSCNSSFVAGDNVLRFVFPTGVNDAFISGGYLKVTYSTDEFQEETPYGFDQVHLPGITGIVNVYDAFIVPGILNNLSVYLAYDTNRSAAQNYTFYMTIGNHTVLFDVSTSEQTTVSLNDSYLRSIISYPDFTNKTVPFRLGFQNLTYETEFAGNADVMLVTDVSGSMDWEMGSDSDGQLRNCADSLFDSSSTQRLSVAKCLDNQFIDDILNYSGNRVGLVSYSSSTVAGDTVAPTTTISDLTSVIGTAVPQTGYTAGGGTCICCGINSARDQLVVDRQYQTIFGSRSSWKYLDTSLKSTPSADGSGNQWFESSFDDSAWPAQNAILGATNGQSYAPLVDNELLSDLSGDTQYFEFPESLGDDLSPVCDFSSNVLNSSSNSYGWDQPLDGWDWDPEDGSGPWGFDDDITYFISNGVISLEAQQSGSNVCSQDDCSGGYGVHVSLNTTLQDMISSGAQVFISFDYEWERENANFEQNDQVWIKGAVTSPSGVVWELGDDLDSGHSASDSQFEIATADNPSLNFQGNHFQQITDAFDEGIGSYYVELGGKLRASQSSEFGTWSFDNIAIWVSNASNDYYFRKSFTLAAPGSGVPSFFPESLGDDSNAEADFSSGLLNSSGNTFGWSGGVDGWDWDIVDGSGPFGEDDDFNYSGVVGQVLAMDMNGANSCSNYDCSGAYGVEFDITAEQASLLASGSAATLSFDYTWTPAQLSFEDNDEVLVKARITDPSGSSLVLGEDRDGAHSNGDASFDIVAGENPNDALAGSAVVPIQDALTYGAGAYYLEVGGVLFASVSSERGSFTFDNIHISVGDLSTDRIGRGILQLLIDERATAYLNGEKIYESDTEFSGIYWSDSSVAIPKSAFIVGENVLAVKLANTVGAAKFDAALVADTNAKLPVIMVMSDGIATQQCGEQKTGSSSSDAILAACQARQDYGIVTYSVGYGSTADQATLSEIASCGGGRYNQSDNTTALSSFYTDVAYSILEASLQSQSVAVLGEYQSSSLLEGSHINLSYTPLIPEPEVGEIELLFQTAPFYTCTPTITIPSEVRIAEAYVTSYSGDHWSDGLWVNGVRVHDFTPYNSPYNELGDPFRISIPPGLLVSGDNSLVLRTGDAPSNSTGCSLSNSLIYRAFLPSVTARTSVLESSSGCEWTIETELGTNNTVRIPTSYSGPQACSYTNTSISYDSQSASQQAVAGLLAGLDLDGDGRIIISLAEENLQIVTNQVESVPYLWGPIIFSAEASQ